MLQADRICIWIFIAGFAMMLPSTLAVKFVDELCSLLLLGVALTDSLVNGQWRRYRLLWIIMGIMTVYALYSLIFLHYNRPSAIAVDWLIQLKPYIPFAVFLAIAPEPTPGEKRVLSIIAGMNAIILAILMILGHETITATLEHISYAGSGCMMCALIMLWCNLDADGRPPVWAIAFATIILTVGLGCTRAKYYGVYMIALFYIFLYRPGMLRGVRPGHICLVGLLILAVILVGWNKFQFYFLTGGADKFDPRIVESFARPVLYSTGALILINHFPFGTGLASFASFASEKPYSTVYYEYGINNVWGLSPHEPFFICDAFYPSLAQFGIAGIVLFAWFWIYVYRRLSLFVRLTPETGRYLFGIGMILIFFIFIESVASTMFVQSHGMIAMIILGMLCGRAGQLVQSPQNSSLKQQITSQ